MRGLLAVVVVFCSLGVAQAALPRHEPAQGMLRPGQSVLVDNGRCGRGKVDQITGGNSLGGRHAGTTPRSHHCVARP